jgi:hypothetical protein
MGLALFRKTRVDCYLYSLGSGALIYTHRRSTSPSRIMNQVGVPREHYFCIGTRKKKVSSVLFVRIPASLRLRVSTDQVRIDLLPTSPR